MEHLVTMAEREGCHSDESENDAKAHIGSGNSIEMPVQKKV